MGREVENRASPEDQQRRFPPQYFDLHLVRRRLTETIGSIGSELYTEDDITDELLGIVRLIGALIDGYEADLTEE